MTEWIDLTRHPVLPRLEERKHVADGRVLDPHRKLRDESIKYESIIETEVIDNSSFAGRADITVITYLVAIEGE